MNYKNVWLSACFGASAGGGLINVKFKGDTEEQPFTMAAFEMLQTDPLVEYITSSESGEVLFYRD